MDVISASKKSFQREFEREFMELQYLRQLQWSTICFKFSDLKVEYLVTYSLVNETRRTKVSAVIVKKKRNELIKVSNLCFQAFDSEVGAYSELKKTIYECIKGEL